jgi:hypothetical protein
MESVSAFRIFSSKESVRNWQYAKPDKESIVTNWKIKILMATKIGEKPFNLRLTGFSSRNPIIFFSFKGLLLISQRNFAKKALGS